MKSIDEAFQLDAKTSAPLRFVPFDQAGEAWDQLIACDPAATLYHKAAWAETLRRSYGLRLQVALVERYGEIVAGCLLTGPRISLFRRLVGLPFSDSCAPLALDDFARESLMRGLAIERKTSNGVEIRGIDAPAPWRTINCFKAWSLDLKPPFEEVRRAADRNFRRQATRAAAEGCRIEVGDSPEFVRRFYRLHLQTRRRLAVPPQPIRFFDVVREAFGGSHQLEVWLASRDRRDVAAVVLLRDGANLYAKWSARAPDNSAGASHLVFFSLLENHAGKASSLDLGRTDVRNVGLNRFKTEMGAKATPLPYSYFPRVPRQPSAEVPGRAAGVLPYLWRFLPLSITRFIGATVYPFLA